MRARVLLLFAGFIVLLFSCLMFFSPKINDGYQIIVEPPNTVFSFEENASRRTFVVFLGGDTEIEGFFEVYVGITYGELFTLAGFNHGGSYPLDSHIVPRYTPVPFPVDNTVIWPADNITLIAGNCLNINYADYEDLIEITDLITARLISDFISEQGAVNNKRELLNVLQPSQYEQIKNKIYAIRY